MCFTNDFRELSHFHNDLLQNFYMKIQPQKYAAFEKI